MPENPLTRPVRGSIYAAAVACAILISQPVRAQSSVQLSGAVSPQALKLPTYGDLPYSQTLPLEIHFKPRNQAVLEKLLAEQQDPASPKYHKWLTPDEYARRFGVTQDEFDRVSRWLTDEGFQITGGSPAQGFVAFNGSVLAVSRVFNTRIMKFAADGSRFANVSEPQVPVEYGSLIGSITGLDNLHASKAMGGHVSHPTALPSPHSRLKNASPLSETPLELAMLSGEPDVTIGNNGTHVGPSDFYAFYDGTPLKNAGITGTRCIAIIGDSDFRTAPVKSFNQQFGLPENSGSIAKILADSSNPGINVDEGETLLDLEWSHAVAPAATIKYFLGNPNVQTPNGPIVDALQAAVTDGTCGVISVSFSICGGTKTFFTSTVGNIVNQAQTQGQTILVASGDDGAAGLIFNVNTGCVTGTSRNVNELASNPLITSIGGTSFDASAFNGSGNVTTYTSERTWNDPEDLGSNDFARYGATGGGASVFFGKPSFQGGVTPNDGQRDQPDVSLLASPNFPGSFYYDDAGGTPVLGIIGGTSIGTPMWAGIVDLLIQKTGGNVGSINATVYKMASAGQSAAGFHDINLGNNNFNNVTGFNAGTGYDQTTGWGTVDINTFVNAYNPSGGGTPTPTPSPTVSAALQVSPGSVNFGNTKVGKVKRKSVTLRNAAPKKGGATITFKSPLATLPSGGPFSLAGTTCHSTLAPTKKCKLTVMFQPATANNPPTSVSTTVTVFDNASNSNQTFGLVGTAMSGKKK